LRGNRALIELYYKIGLGC